jgi:EmrB/QacA subfamily drug resistance transporter
VEGTHRKALMALLLIGVFMGALDLAIIGPALPAIQADFDMSSRGLAWLFNIYVLFQLVGTPLLAKMSDRYGPRPIYITSISLFAAGSLIIVLAPDESWLYIGRAIQGFGGAGIFPLAVSVIGDIFPPEKRGGALGLLGAVFGIAFLIGPILGGILLQFSWQWLFLINLPIAFALILGAWRLMPEGTIGKDHKPFDLAGALTLSIGLTALAIAITNFDSNLGIDNLTAIAVWPFLLCAAIFAPLYWRYEKRAADPIIRPAFFDNRQITIASAISLGLGAMQSGTAFYPALAVAAMDISVSNAAFLLVPGILITTIASPLAGILINRLGSRLLVVFGLICISIAFMLYGLMDINKMLFITASCIAGLGFAVSLGAPLRIVVLNSAPERDRGSAQGLLNVSVNIGQLLGAAIVGGVAASQGGGAAGYQAAYIVLGCITAALVIPGIGLQQRTSVTTDQ